MGIDDQLFKEDGTWITKIDNLLLKLAALLATPLLHEDDETYNRAFRGLLRVGSLLALISMIFLVPFGPVLIAGYLSIFVIGPWMVSLREKCNGLGSTIDPSEKLGYLVAITAMALVIAVSGPLIMLTYGKIQFAQGATWLLSSTAVFLFVMFYVARLGAPPPKRKKAKAHRFAWHH